MLEGHAHNFIYRLCICRGKKFKNHWNGRFRHITGPQFFIIILWLNYMIRFLQMGCAWVCNSTQDMLRAMKDAEHLPLENGGRKDNFCSGKAQASELVFTFEICIWFTKAQTGRMLILGSVLSKHRKTGLRNKQSSRKSVIGSEYSAKDFFV